MWQSPSTPLTPRPHERKFEYKRERRLQLSDSIFEYLVGLVIPHGRSRNPFLAPKPFPSFQRGREGEVHILSFPCLQRGEGGIHLLSAKPFPSFWGGRKGEVHILSFPSLQRGKERFISCQLNHFPVFGEVERERFISYHFPVCREGRRDSSFVS